MSEAAPWVCGNCRSVNRAADTRCYSCRVPRTLALDPNAREAPARKLAADTPPDKQAAAARELGATLRDTGSLATLAQVAVLLVTAITLARVVLVIRFVIDAPTLDTDAALAQLPALVIIQYVDLGAWFLGLVAWGAWLGRVVGNIPGLGGGWPHATPRSTFLTTLIPGGNLYWTTSIMREVLTSLSPAGSPRLGAITAWWLTVTPAAILLLNVGPVRYIRGIVETVLLVLLDASGDVNAVAETIVIVELLGAVLLVTAAGLAILLVQLIEGLQAERRAAVGAGAATAS
jgi:hypothetical protein